MFFNYRQGIFIVFFLFQACFTYSQVVLKFQGAILGENSVLSGVTLQIARGGKIVNNVKTDDMGNYKFELKLNYEYLITVSKKGYVSKRFAVNTKGVPPEKASQEFPIIAAHLTLYKKLKGIDYSLYNQPLCKYSYNPTKDNFEYDKAYLEQKKLEIKEIEKAEQALKEKSGK